MIEELDIAPKESWCVVNFSFVSLTQNDLAFSSDTISFADVTSRSPEKVTMNGEAGIMCIALYPYASEEAGDLHFEVFKGGGP